MTLNQKFFFVEYKNCVHCSENEIKDIKMNECVNIWYPRNVLKFKTTKYERKTLHDIQMQMEFKDLVIYLELSHCLEQRNKTKRKNCYQKKKIFFSFIFTINKIKMREKRRDASSSRYLENGQQK